MRKFGIFLLVLYAVLEILLNPFARNDLSIKVAP